MRVRRRLSFTGLLLIVCGVLLPGPAAASPGQGAYLAKLIQKARDRGLAESDQWRALLHYESRVFGVESRADDPDFFFAPNGKTDARAELEATLGAFFRPPSPHQPVQEGEEGRQHPQCAFPARYHWLKEKLDFDPRRLPERPCPRFEWWRDQLNASGVTLVFPAAYMNNPSSMFGHTLLRLDRPDQTPETRMLAYAVNYAAVTGNDGGMLFAVKGLTGFYPGRFSIAPYYDKVKLYSDLESRDVWEYSLDLTPAETARMVRHVWELRGIRFDYYFFDENCASQLLALVEVARPGLSLTAQFDFHAIPADTVRVTRRVPGLIEDAVFRPALETELLHRAERLPPRQQMLARAVAEGRTSPQADALTELPATARARTLELANTYLRYLNAGEERSEEAAARSREILVARSRVPAKGMKEPPVPPAVRPDEGHRSGRVHFGAGLRRGYGFQEIRLRPAYHDLLDPEGGFVPGAAIELFDLTARRYQDGGDVEIHRFELVNILSLAPRDRFRKPISWRINTAVDRFPLSPAGDFGRRPWRWRTNGGAGLTWDLAGQGLVYGLLEGTLDVAGSLERNGALGAGPRLGLVLDPTRAWRIHLHGGVQRFGLGADYTEAGLHLDQRLRLGRNHALRLEAGRRYLFGQWWTEAQLGWSWYL